MVLIVRNKTYILLIPLHKYLTLIFIKIAKDSYYYNLTVLCLFK